MNIDLAGHTALVTGGAGQLGRVMVRTLAECGANVAIHYLSSGDKAESLVEEVRAMGRQAMSVKGDVTNFESVKAMGEAVRAEMGSPDIVVANAVIQIDPWLPLLEEDPDDYRSQFESCVMQSVYLAKTFVPQMITGGWGRYIAINTECAIEAAAGSSAYVSGKRGLDGIIRTLAKEIGQHNITVNQVAPGWTYSDRHRETPPDDTRYVQSVPLGRRGTDQEIANAVAFLASDLASYITGAFLPVAGGRVMASI